MSRMKISIVFKFPSEKEDIVWVEYILKEVVVLCVFSMQTKNRATGIKTAAKHTNP